MKIVKLIDIDTKKEIARIPLKKWRKEFFKNYNPARSNGMIASKILGDHRIYNKYIDAIIIETNKY